MISEMIQRSSLVCLDECVSRRKEIKSTLPAKAGSDPNHVTHCIQVSLTGIGAFAFGAVTEILTFKTVEKADCICTPLCYAALSGAKAMK